MDSDFSRYYELSLPVVAKPKRRTAGIEWSDEMIEIITSKFALLLTVTLQMNWV